MLFAVPSLSSLRPSVVLDIIEIKKKKQTIFKNNLAFCLKKKNTTNLPIMATGPVRPRIGGVVNNSS